MKKTLLVFLTAVLFVCGCVSSGKQRRDPGIQSLYHDEIAIGEKIHAQILSSFHIYTEPELVAYVNQVGESIAKYADKKNLPYRFTVLYSEKIYATSAPGGFVYLTTGLINFLANEAELAGVLAHEIAELQFEDPRLSKNYQALETLTRGVSVVGPVFGQIGALAVLGMVAVNAVADSMKMTVTKRLLKADGLALDYMIRAGYDPQGFMDFADKIKASEPRLESYFSDYHVARPFSDERLQHLNTVFAGLPLEGKTLKVNHERYNEMVYGIREIYKAS